MNIHEFRQQYPEYNEVSDDDLSKRLHAKFYSDVPYKEFSDRFGVRSGFGKVKEMFTGADRQTDETKSLQEIGAAPEMNDLLSSGAWKTAAGLNFSLGSDDSARKAIDHIGGTLRKDSKGNDIVDLPSGSYMLNQPGFSTQDAMQLGSVIGSYMAGGGLAQGGKSLGAAALRQGSAAGGVNAGIQKLRGEEEIDPKEMALTAGLGAGAEFILPALKGLGSLINRGKEAGPKLAKPEIYDDVVNAGERHNVQTIASDFSPRIAKTEQTVQQIPGSGGAKFHEQRVMDATRAADEFTNAARVADDPGAAAQQSAQGRLNRFKQLERARYNKVDRLLDDAGEVPMNNFVKTLQQEIGKAETRNTPVGRKVVSELDQWMSSTSPRNFSSAREMRSDLLSRSRELEKATDSQVSTQAGAALKKLSQSLDDDLSMFAGQNPQAKDLWRVANQEWKEAMNVYKGGAQSSKVVKRALDTGEVSKIPRMIMQNPSKEKTLEMYNALGADGRKAVYQGLLDDAYKVAMDENTGALSLGRYATNLRKVYESAGPFVSGQAKQELDGFAKLMKVSARSLDEIRNPKTGFANISSGAGAAQVVGGLSGQLPLVVTATLASRGANKALTSTAFRRFMFEASKTKAGSPAWDKLLRQVEYSMKTTPAMFGISQAEMGEILKGIESISKR